MGLAGAESGKAREGLREREASPEGGWRMARGVLVTDRSLVAGEDTLTAVAGEEEAAGDRVEGRGERGVRGQGRGERGRGCGGRSDASRGEVIRSQCVKATCA